MELTFEDLEMQKSNVPTDSAQRVDEKKNESFVNLSCLLPELCSLIPQKWLSFCIFC